MSEAHCRPRPPTLPSAPPKLGPYTGPPRRPPSKDVLRLRVHHLGHCAPTWAPSPFSASTLVDPFRQPKLEALLPLSHVRILVSNTTVLLESALHAVVDLPLEFIVKLETSRLNSWPNEWAQMGTPFSRESPRKHPSASASWSPQNCYSNSVNSVSPLKLLRSSSEKSAD